MMLLQIPRIISGSLKLPLGAVVALLAILLFSSCKKEYSCEGCNDGISGNKPTLAITGQDTCITLPADSVLLDGSVVNGVLSDKIWKLEF